MVCFENVPGFRSGKHYQCFLQELAKSGFKIAFSTMHDLQQLSYCSRKRWLAVAVNTLFQERGKPIETQWADPLIKRVQSFDPQKHTIRTLTPEQVQQSVPTKHEAEVLRKYKKDLQVIDSGMIVPTVTASLRESPNFSEELLDQRGLYAFLIRDANSCVRWMSPFEAARALGFSMATTLPQEFKQAQRLVGNAM